MKKYGIESVGYAFSDGSMQMGFADLHTGQNIDMNPSNLGQPDAPEFELDKDMFTNPRDNEK